MPPVSTTSWILVIVAAALIVAICVDAMLLWNAWQAENQRRVYREFFREEWLEDTDEIRLG